MKRLICILIITLLHRATSFPLGEQQPATLKINVSASTDEKVSDLKSDLVSSSVSISEKPATEPSTVKSEKVEVSELSTTAPVKEIKTDAIPESTPTTEAQTEKSNNVAEGANKVVVDNKPAVEVAKVPEVEQVSSPLEKPKESNEQINTVSADEPKPVQNDVKSEVLKEEIKTEISKPENVAEKKDEVKNEKSTTVENATPVTTEEASKKFDPSEEKRNDSVEKAVSKEEEKDSIDKSKGQVKSEETDVSATTEKRDEPAAIKKEIKPEEKKEDKGESVVKTFPESSQSSESSQIFAGSRVPAVPAATEKSELPALSESTKTLAGSKVPAVPAVPAAPVVPAAPAVTEKLEHPETLLSSEASKIFTGSRAPAVSAAPAVIEKSEQGRDVIKREATKEKHEDKKSTALKKEKVSTVPKDSQTIKEIKSAKGQDNPAH